MLQDVWLSTTRSLESKSIYGNLSLIYVNVVVQNLMGLVIQARSSPKEDEIQAMGNWCLLVDSGCTIMSYLHIKHGRICMP